GYRGILFGRGAAFRYLPPRGAPIALRGGRPAGGEGGGHRDCHSLQRFRRLLVALPGRAGAGAELPDATRRRSANRPARDDPDAIALRARWLDPARGARL